MATDKTGTWSLGESVLWYTPTASLDPTWSLGESIILDETVARDVWRPLYRPRRR